ncbi:MAG: tRNA (adenosine(37)-N6)-threonylcarbamoyltransferase complex ATPase subunit type 1 TsaE [Candidatus Nealsonbacteria bacterium]|nr:tRNA (adenosine(37)-N6)-threonylcarbamoyltransferase complex ATPase subunit type 1 TsaE [Candidatus Nealsonbacteria bacterium]
MSTKFLTTSALQTKKAGETLAKKILKAKLGRKAKALGLIGDLGGGKTTFLQGFAKGLGIKAKINSPTFVIMKRFGNFYHFDCYRIEKPKELLDLGFKKIIANPKNIVAIEWADRIKKILPKSTIWLNFQFINATTRQIMLK